MDVTSKPGQPGTKKMILLSMPLFARLHRIKNVVLKNESDWRLPSKEVTCNAKSV